MELRYGRLSSPTTSAASGPAQKPRTKPVHPITCEMVGSAIKSIKKRGGSSQQAIKKYISANYKVDSEKLALSIKKYLKSAVASGELVQTKGKEASGSFKLASAAKPEKASAAPVKRSAAPKEKRILKAKKAAAKKSIAKKPAETKKAALAPKPKKYSTHGRRPKS
ncbi:histone H1-II-like [Anabrus simplex]|uniref:histone H1-II-like n=1 Tax=Anabrus simplex TaxID=316456 RepID=UPI0035A2E38F